MEYSNFQTLCSIIHIIFHVDFVLLPLRWSHNSNLGGKKIKNEFSNLHNMKYDTYIFLVGFSNFDLPSHRYHNFEISYKLMWTLNLGTSIFILIIFHPMFISLPYLWSYYSFGFTVRPIWKLNSLRARHYSTLKE